MDDRIGVASDLIRQSGLAGEGLAGGGLQDSRVDVSSVLLMGFLLCVGGGYRVEDVFDHFAQLAVDPVGVGDDEGESVFVVGEVDGDEEIVTQK